MEGVERNREVSSIRDGSETLSAKLVLILNEVRSYYMKFSRHVYFAILWCAYFATLKFCDLMEILYFESLLLCAFDQHTVYFLGIVTWTCP